MTMVFRLSAGGEEKLQVIEADAENSVRYNYNPYEYNGCWTEKVK